MRYRLMKSEEEEYSIDVFEKDKRSSWFDVRNYQARNFMRDEMKSGCLFNLSQKSILMKY